MNIKSNSQFWLQRLPVEHWEFLSFEKRGDQQMSKWLLKTHGASTETSSLPSLEGMVGNENRESLFIL